LNENNEIYHPNVKVLLPNKVYCHGFFEIYKIFNIDSLTHDILLYLSLILSKSKVKVIITIGENCKNLLNNKSAKKILKKYLNNVSIFNISTENVFPQSFKVSRRIKDEDGVFLLTDVIGTSKTIKNVLGVLKTKKILKILTIVNTNEEIDDVLVFEQKQYSIEKMLDNPLRFYNELPRNWNYNEIKIINTFLNKLVESKIPNEGPLWIDIDDVEINYKGESFTILRNKFIENIIKSSHSFFYDHFISRSNHLTCLFNIPILIENHSTEISTIILDYIKEKINILQYKTNDKRNLPVDYVFYPEFNPGLDKIADDIVKRIDKCKSFAVNETHFQSGLDSKIDLKNNAIALIDDAFISGGTINKLVRLVEEKNAEHVFIFAIIKRGNYEQARDFERKKKYGETSIDARYLVDAEMPIFKEDNCPVCHHLKSLNTIRDEIDRYDNLKELKYYLNTIITSLREKTVSTIFQEDKLLKEAKDNIYRDNIRIDEEEPNYDRMTYVNFRWKLEQAIKEENFNMRKDISSLIENFYHHPERTLLIIEILSNEKLYFLIDEKNRKNLLYSGIENNIIESCKYFLKNPKNLTHRNLYYILNVLIEFNEQFIAENLAEIIRKCRNDDRKISTLLIILFQIKIFQENPLQVSIILDQLKNDIIDEQIFGNIDSVSKFFERKQKEIQASKEKKSDTYSELRVMLHRIRHNIESIEHYVKPENYDKEMLYKSWNILHEIIEKFDNTLTSFMKSIVSKSI